MPAMQKKEYTLGGGGEELAEGALGPGAANGTLGLFLLLAGQPECRFTGVDDEATAVAIVALFLLPRGRPRPRFSIGAPMFSHDPPASAMEASVCQEETLDEIKKKKMMRQRKNLMTELGFLPSLDKLYL
jgi:hypothetical protein